MSTTLSTALEVKRIASKYFPELKLNFVDPFYNHPDYIKALSESIKPHLKKFDKLILSYHGIPMRHIKKSDVLGSHCEGSKSCCSSDNEAAHKCYRSNCYHTSNLTANYLNLNSNDWMMTFQSRVSIISPDWLKPYTDKELNKLPSENINRVGVACPSFIADCLETLEEINMRGREDFIEAGGTSFTYIPCLNDDKYFISALEKIISAQ